MTLPKIDNDRSIGDGPGIGVDQFKRKPLRDDVFETSLSVDQCKAILRATRRHDVNFRVMNVGAKLQTLIEVMRKDRWVWTDADPIRLHLHVESGEVVCSDGQHRLLAAARARRTLHTLVLWGDTWRAGVHVDRNMPRRVAQYLRHDHGIGSANVYVSAARFHLARVIANTDKLAVNYARNTIDDETVIDFVLTNLDALQWATNHGNAGASRGFSMTGYMVFLFELQTISTDLAEQFHVDFLNMDLSTTDPLAQLRRSVGRRYNDTGIRSSVAYTITNLVKAHDMRSAGDTVTKWVSASNDEAALPAGFRINGELVKGANNR